MNQLEQDLRECARITREYGYVARHLRNGRGGGCMVGVIMAVGAGLSNVIEHVADYSTPRHQHMIHAVLQALGRESRGDYARDALVIASWNDSFHYDGVEDSTATARIVEMFERAADMVKADAAAETFIEQVKASVATTEAVAV